MTVPEQEFQGQVLISMENAVRYVSESDLQMWIEKPEDNQNEVFSQAKSDCIPTNFTECLQDEGYMYEVNHPAKIPWTRISPKTLKELNDNIYRYKYKNLPYNWRTNNCQHFAEDMYVKAQL